MTRRVLFVNTPTYIGGAELSILTTMKGISRELYVPLFMTAGEGRFTTQVKDAGIPIWIQDFPWFSRRRPWRYAASITRLARTIKKTNTAIIHTNCDHCLRYVMYASKLTGVPYVCHIRDFTRTWFQRDKLVVLSAAARVIAISNAIADACVNAGIEPSRVTTLYDGVDLEIFPDESSSTFSLHAQLRLSDNATVFGIVGQIQPTKGHREFIKACTRLAAEIADAHFVIVGEAPPGGSDFLTSLLEMVQQSRYAERFHFLGFRQDITTVMKGIDVLVVPSWSEPFGRVIVEGLATGCAVIATRAGGVPEIITDAVDGVLVRPTDIDELFDAMHRVGSSRALRQELARAGRLTAHRFRTANHVKQLHTLYDEVLA